MRGHLRPAGSSWVAALFLGVLALPAWHPAGAASWQPIGPPDGATVLSLAYAPSRPAVVYAGLAGGGVHRSDDGGLTWKPAGSGLGNPVVSSLAVDPANPDAVYAATERGFFRSTDGGRSWQTAPTVNVLKAHAVAVDPADPRVVYLGTAMGLFRSTNRGAAWQLLTAGLIPPHLFDFEVVALAIDAVHPNQLYAAHIGVRDGIHKSVDGGRSWIALRTLRVDALAVDPVDDSTVWAAGADGVWVSADGGQKFTKVRVEPAHALLVDPFDHTRVYAANANDLQVTTDGGRSWRTASSGLLSGGALALAADPSGPGVLLAGTAGAGVYRSTDGAGTWAASGVGLVNTPISRVVVDDVDAAIFAVGPAGVYRSHDGGASWELNLAGGGNSVALAGAPSQPRTLYAALLPLSQVSRTQDGGDHWEQVSDSLGTSSLAVSAGDPATVYAATTQGLMKSTDGGASWATVFQGFPYQVVADPVDPESVYLLNIGIGREQLWASHDGGATWVLLLQKGALLGVAIGRDMPPTILASGDQSIFGSPDGGRTWSVLIRKLPLPYALAVDPQDARILYVGSGVGIERSTDGGAHWRPFNQGLFARGFNQLLFDPGDPFRLYAASSAAGLFVYDFPQ